MLSYEGDLNKVLYKYVHGDREGRDIDLSAYPRAGHSVPGFRFENISLIYPEEQLYEGGTARFLIRYRRTAALQELVMGITVSDAYQTLIECRSTASYPELSFNDNEATGTVEVTVPMSIRAGSYTINMGARALSGLLEYIPSVMTLEVLPAEQTGFEEWNKPSAGVLLAESHWQIK